MRRFVPTGVTGLIIGLVFTYLGISEVLTIVRCNEKVTGRYRGFDAYKGAKGCNIYAPIFEYEYDGRKYRLMSVQAFSRKGLRRFAEGEEYELLIDADTPENVIVDRKIGMLPICMLVFGAIFLIMALISFIG